MNGYFIICNNQDRSRTPLMDEEDELEIFYSMQEAQHRIRSNEYMWTFGAEIFKLSNGELTYGQG